MYVTVCIGASPSLFDVVPVKTIYHGVYVPVKFPHDTSLFSTHLVDDLETAQGNVY